VTLPNFLIVGAPKAGTTSLYDYLRPHPEIFLPHLKEPRFFCYRGQDNPYYYPVRTLAEYEALYDGVTNETAIGDTSAFYFEFDDTPGRIHAAIPDARIVVTLREPVQRSFSIYHMQDRDTGRHQGRGFLEALEHDPTIRKLYYPSLKPYYELFGRDRIRIILFEELSDDTLATVQDLFGWLGVSRDFVPNLKISNPGGVPKLRLLHDVLIDTRVRDFARRFVPAPLVQAAKDVRSANLRKHVMTEEEREKGYAWFEEDLLRTQELIGIDLSRWLRPSARAAAG
jgi:Sulfotransferase family